MTRRPFLPVPAKIAAGLLLTLPMALSLFAAEGAAETPANKSALELILHGGPMIIAVWVAILATSVTMVTLIIQNIMTLQKNKLAPPELVTTLQAAFNDGNYQECWQICQANKCYIANILSGALERIGRGKDVFESTLLSMATREASALKSRNAYLSVIGVIAPMIGLLGTVIGMMNAFSTLAAEGIGNPRALAASIGEVLLATASGLFIAIPAFISYYIFRNISQNSVVLADDAINNLVTDIPFSELEGVKIGNDYDASGGARKSGKKSQKVSRELTTNCPSCNSPITPGSSPCPVCGQKLQWG